jgi:catechol 2,3-dioxygenase-like lactoylglutathione lyase family enzyme
LTHQVSALEFATLSVSQLDGALRLFRDLMGWQVDTEYSADAALLDFWRSAAPSEAPATLRAARVVELSARGYPLGRLRLLQVESARAQYVRRDADGEADAATDVGPKALDFYVRPPIARVVEKLAAAGYAARSAPVYHRIGKTVSEEVLVSGPDGVPLLFMIGHAHAPTSLRAGSPEGEFSEIPTVSIIVGDLERSREFYLEVLGLVAVNDAETPPEYRDLVDDLTGVPRGTRVHFLNCAAHGEPSGKILLLHFFERTGKRLTARMRPGNLGFSMLTHRVQNLDSLQRSMHAHGFAPLTAPVSVGRDRRMLVSGPNEELFEFVQYG